MVLMTERELACSVETFWKTPKVFRKGGETRPASDRKKDRRRARVPVLYPCKKKPTLCNGA